LDREADASAAPGPDPLAGWRSATLEERSRMLEEDVRRLLRELAEARFQLGGASQGVTEAKKRLLLQMLEVLDAFDRVFRNVQSKEDQVTPQMKIWLGNFRAVRRLLDKIVGEEGVARMENLGDGFDPRWHTVGDTLVDPSRPEGTIVEESRAGYFWGREVLRKAEVVVVKNSD
jgi:molecular chaperone GrpE